MIVISLVFTISVAYVGVVLLSNALCEFPIFKYRLDEKRRAEGRWLSIMTRDPQTDEENFIGLADVTYDPETNQLVFSGHAFTRTGAVRGEWRHEYAYFQPLGRVLYYGGNGRRYVRSDSGVGTSELPVRVNGSVTFSSKYLADGRFARGQNDYRNLSERAEDFKMGIRRTVYYRFNERDLDKLGEQVFVKKCREMKYLDSILLSPHPLSN